MKPTIEYDDFDKLDLRIGKVVMATLPDWSSKLIEFVVDFGEEIGRKTILSGVRKWYEPEYFEGNKYIFVVNLAERTMGEGVSQGMMLMTDESEQPVPVQVHDTAPVGVVVR